VRDFASKNGTFVNGERVRTERELKTGDHVRLGPLEFEVQLGVTVGGKKKPKVQSVTEAASRTVEAAAEEDVDIFDLLGGEDK
ncbi:MAG: FHA domain-containing protein, partial [Planctomycetales bacterium]|nr:FHA domain-containing protein [Planctomycetales bacterium]NIP69174.1 FHA domain-containing protein [Planctomycetales bacterium]